MADEGPGSSLLSREVAEYIWVIGDPSLWHRRSGPLQLIKQWDLDCCLREDDMEHRTVSKKFQPGLDVEGG